MQARVKTQLTLKRIQDLLHDKNAFLEAEVCRRMKENQTIQNVCIRALAHLAETRDPETGEHILRTQAYIHILAKQLQNHPRFKATLTEHYIELLIKSAPLHDIGKVGIPDHILCKPGKLNAEEWLIMKTHAEIGAHSIELAEKDLDQSIEFLTLAKQIARWHHERWDGGGYPDGLTGDDIPLSARFMALADVFDALISKRVYKPAMSYENARDYIIAGRNQHFDPDITDVFLKALISLFWLLASFKQAISIQSKQALVSVTTFNIGPRNDEDIPDNSFVSHLLVIIGGWIISILGFTVLFGWYTHNETLIQVSAAFVPMQYNTALGFVVSGLSFVMIRQYHAVVALCGAFVLFLGLLTLLQYIFGFDLGIDQLMMKHYISVATSNPGRMAPNTALCFFFNGYCIRHAFQTKQRMAGVYGRWVSGALIFGLGVIALTGDVVGLETAYGWGS